VYLVYLPKNPVPTRTILREDALEPEAATVEARRRESMVRVRGICAGQVPMQ
jgi:hypothetical protein